ncbi:MAG: DUF4445 domain-containing protein [Clostridioides difficile]|nr:ASKHA domain-containing protein [Clostridioides sp.]MBS5787461.1 DUF4445 domain-containing protein [Clostridioides difficile]
MNYLYINNDKYEFNIGMNLLDLIQKNKLGLESPCGGNGTCGKCKLKIINGNVNDLTDDELKFLTDEEIKNNVRLSCLVYPKGDLSVEFINNDNNVHKILTEGYIPNFNKSPMLSKKVYKINKPTLQYNLSLEDNLKQEGIILNDDFNILKSIPSIFEKDYCTVVYLGNEVIGLECEDTSEKLYGIALDIGTTTVVASLIDINKQCEIDCESDINPQKEYGLDVLSRIHYSKSNKEGLENLNRSIIDCINNLILELCKNNKINKDEIYEVAIAANTTMMHTLLKVSPNSIGKSPYSPVFTSGKSIKALDLGIEISMFGRVYLLPGVSSYIGADIVAGVCVSDLSGTNKNILFIDIGTNGEIVLSKRSKLSSCSCAAGPALEGMNISCGMRAGDGAIENIKIGKTIETKVIGNKEGKGLCGSGIIDAISEMARLKLIGKTGRIIKKSEVETDDKLKHLSEHIVDENKKRRFILDPQNPNISITQEDIRQVQLAKGAILSGFYALLNTMNIDIKELDEVIIAGQFGKHLSVDSLVGVGIIPKELKENVRYIGNSSKTGAIMTLLSKDIRKDMERIARDISYCELSTEDGYERLFANCLKF